MESESEGGGGGGGGATVGGDFTVPCLSTAPNTATTDGSTSDSVSLDGVDSSFLASRLSFLILYEGVELQMLLRGKIIADSTFYIRLFDTGVLTLSFIPAVCACQGTVKVSHSMAASSPSLARRRHNVL